MIIASSILPLILSVSTVVHAAPLNRRQQECSDIKIIVARGSTEPQGEGFTGAFATLVKNGPCAKDKKITSTALVYPAQLVPYTPSVNEGIKNMAALLESEVKNCPKQDLVLMGWSQGAHLIGSVLSGEKQFSNGILGAIGFFDKPAEPKMPKVPKGGLVALASQLGMNPLDAVDTNDKEEEADLAEEADGEEESEEFAFDAGQDDEEEEGTETEESDEGEERRLFRRQSSDLIKELDKKVKAVIFLGDPTFLPGEPFDLGTNKDKTGLFPRTKGQLSQFASRIQSYCDTTDPFCQAGGALLPTHFGYFIKYDKDSAAFVNQKLCNAK